MSEVVFVLTVVALGIFWVGHFVGYYSGWSDGYWTEHDEYEGASDE